MYVYDTFECRGESYQIVPLIEAHIADKEEK